MDLEIPHNQKSFYSKVLFQNKTVFSGSLTFPLPKYATVLRENSWRFRQGGEQGTKIDCVFHRLTRPLDMTLSKEVRKRQDGVIYSLCVNIKQKVLIFLTTAQSLGKDKLRHFPYKHGQVMFSLDKLVFNVLSQIT